MNTIITPPHLIAITATFLGPTDNLGCRVKLEVPYFKEVSRRLTLNATGRTTLELCLEYFAKNKLGVASFCVINEKYTFLFSFDQADAIKTKFSKGGK